MLSRIANLTGIGAGKQTEDATLESSANVDAAPVTEEAVRWALRLLVGREPASLSEIALHQRNANLGDLRAAFMQTPEFSALLARAGQSRPGFAIPPFLLRRPSNPAIPWTAERPTLSRPASQLCTAAQFAEPEFERTIAALQMYPSHHRKLWEHAYIIAVLRSAVLIEAGQRGIVFGCGRERIPAYLAAHGVAVLATDAPDDAAPDQGWTNTAQFAANAADLFFPGVVERETFDRLVSFRPVDMNAIPDDLAGQFDFCWSTCSLEHLGSLRHGLDFIENSLSVLRPGGVAVHTTEFNLGSNDDTLESPGLSVYRRRDIEELAAHLTARGHSVMPLTFHPGDTELDEVIDLPPYATPHLKLDIQGLPCTSIGITIRRGA